MHLKLLTTSENEESNETSPDAIVIKCIHICIFWKKTCFSFVNHYFLVTECLLADILRAVDCSFPPEWSSLWDICLANDQHVGKNEGPEFEQHDPLWGKETSTTYKQCDSFRNALWKENISCTTSLFLSISGDTLRIPFFCGCKVIKISFCGGNTDQVEPPFNLLPCSITILEYTSIMESEVMGLYSPSQRLGPLLLKNSLAGLVAPSCAGVYIETSWASSYWLLQPAVHLKPWTNQWKEITLYSRTIETHHRHQHQGWICF